MPTKVERKSYCDKKTGETRWTEKYYMFHAGKRISTGKTTKQEARKWAREHLAQNGDQQRKSQLQQKRRKAPLVQHLARWEQDLGDGEWNQTKVARVRNLLGWCNFRKLADLDARMAGRELDLRVKNGELAKKTANGYITEIRSFGDWLAHG